MVTLVDHLDMGNNDGRDGRLNGGRAKYARRYADSYEATTEPADGVRLGHECAGSGERCDRERDARHGDDRRHRTVEVV